jgi:hypothetical protein
MVKNYTYQWKSDISEEENESKILAKIVNMKKKFKYGPVAGQQMPRPPQLRTK